MRWIKLIALTAALTGATLVMTTAPSPAGAAPAACSTTPTGGTVTRTIWVAGQGLRSYNLRVPAGLTGSAPLLFSLHGLGSNAFFQEVSTGWSQRADLDRFIVAYPAGSAWGQAWNVNQGSPDGAFVRQVAAQISARYCVDPRRVYAEGGSLGGMMAQRLACDHEDVFASVVSTVSAGYDFFGGTCTLSRPTSVGIVNVEGDPLFPTSVGAATRDKWLGLDGCSAVSTPVANPYGANGAIYRGCNGAAEVMWRTYTGSSHQYPSGAAGTDLRDNALGFLMANPLP